VRAGEFVLVISDVTLRELAPAPPFVFSLLDSVDEQHVERVVSSGESAQLQAAYLSAKVVGPACENDAAHIAVATIASVDAIVSWNFKHIVHYEKIMGYERVNNALGYRSPRIYSPYEVVCL
jgi:hypothetical protein